MPIQPIHYGGRLVAATTRDRFVLCDELERRRRDDPERTFVIYMCVHAGDVLNGRSASPYSDAAARHFARACLIPTELAERANLDLKRAAKALRVPERELRHEQATVSNLRD